ncbi:hypothetical protein RZS08_42085, partial [Arthrospira platensis SPKY1]|nr:hypothetical protein [Arthrospira platensis SPKY1]
MIRYDVQQPGIGGSQLGDRRRFGFGGGSRFGFGRRPVAPQHLQQARRMLARRRSGFMIGHGYPSPSCVMLHTSWAQ